MKCLIFLSDSGIFFTSLQKLLKLFALITWNEYTRTDEAKISSKVYPPQCICQEFCKKFFVVRWEVERFCLTA